MRMRIEPRIAGLFRLYRQLAASTFPDCSAHNWRVSSNVGGRPISSVVDDLGHPIRLNGVQLGASLAGKLSSELISIASRDGSGE